MVDWAMLTSRRTILALATVTFSLAAAGAGITAVYDGQLDQTTAPEGPNVTVTTAAQSATTTEPTTNGTVATQTTISSETGPEPATLDVDLDGPPPVKNFVGDVDALHGQLRGSLSWQATDAERVTVVVSTWVPGEGWVEERRETIEVDGPGQTTLASVLGTNTITLADGARADVYDNPESGTIATNQGYVAVTVFVDDGTGIARTQTLEEYAVTVSNIDVQTDATDVNLVATDTSLLNGSNALPGASGTNSIVLENTGSDPGELDIVIEDFDADEGGVTEPEQSVDTPGVVELARALEVRVALVRDDGSTSYVVGGPNEFVRLYELSTGPVVSNVPLGAAERLELRAEWRIDSAVGNEIQSDSVGVDLAFVLTGR